MTPLISEKIKALLKINGLKHSQLADHLGITPQALANKFVRGSFTAAELITIANYTGSTVSFNLKDGTTILLNEKDFNN